MGCVKRIWYLSPMRAAKVQARLRIRAVSPEPSLLAHTSNESRGTFRQKARSLAPLNGWACTVKICNDGMLEDTNSLDGAQIPTVLVSLKLTSCASFNLVVVFMWMILWTSFRGENCVKFVSSCNGKCCFQSLLWVFDTTFLSSSIQHCSWSANVDSDGRKFSSTDSRHQTDWELWAQVMMTSELHFIQSHMTLTTGISPSPCMTSKTFRWWRCSFSSSDDLQ